MPRTCKTLRKPAEQVDNRELGRLDDLLFALAPAIRRGPSRTVERSLRLWGRRAKYLGIEAPEPDGRTPPSGLRNDRLSELVLRDPLVRELSQKLFVAMAAHDAGGRSLVRARSELAAGAAPDEG